MADNGRELLIGIRSAYGGLDAELNEFVAETIGRYRKRGVTLTSLLAGWVGLERKSAHNKEVYLEEINRNYANKKITEIDFRSIGRTLEKTNSEFLSRVSKSKDTLRVIINDKTTVRYDRIPEAKRWEMLDQLISGRP